MDRVITFVFLCLLLSVSSNHTHPQRHQQPHSRFADVSFRQMVVGFRPVLLDFGILFLCGKYGATVFNQELCLDLVPVLYDEAMAAGMQILTYQGDGIAATKADDEYVEHEAFINKMPVVVEKFIK